MANEMIVINGCEYKKDEIRIYLSISENAEGKITVFLSFTKGYKTEVINISKDNLQETIFLIPNEKINLKKIKNFIVKNEIILNDFTKNLRRIIESSEDMTTQGIKQIFIKNLIKFATLIKSECIET